MSIQTQDCETNRGLNAAEVLISAAASSAFDDGTVLVCQREICAKTLRGCGYQNIIVIPELTKKAEEMLEKYEYIILVRDNNKAGATLDIAFLKKFGEMKVKQIDPRFFEDCVDVAELYVKYGTEKIWNLVKSAKIKIEGFSNLDDEPYRGVVRPGKFYVDTGFETIDNAIDSLKSGEVVVVVGRSNAGKSTIVTQFTANAIHQGKKDLLISGEGERDVLINNLYRVVIGNNSNYYREIKPNRRIYKEPTARACKALAKWHKGKFCLFTKGESNLKTTDDLFSMLAYQVRTNHHEVVVVDNLMSVLSTTKASEKWEVQADFIQRCCDLAKAYNIIIIVVLHPVKDYKAGEGMKMEDISGSSDIYNKADVVLGVIREKDEVRIAAGRDGKIQVLKNRNFSNLPSVDITFNYENNTFAEISDDGIATVYDYDIDDFFDPEPVEIPFYVEQ